MALITDGPSHPRRVVLRRRSVADRGVGLAGDRAWTARRSPTAATGSKPVASRRDDRRPLFLLAATPVQFICRRRDKRVRYSFLSSRRRRGSTGRSRLGDHRHYHPPTAPPHTKNPPPSLVIARPLPGNAEEFQPLNVRADYNGLVAASRC